MSTDRRPAGSRSWEEAVVWLKSQPEHADLVSDCYFDDPLIAAAERYYASGEWRAVRELIGRPNGAALDVGAGRGISSYAFARDGWQVTALEPDPSSVVGAGAIRELAAAATLPIEVVMDWGESLPFPDASFELVYGRQILHHARNLSTFCAEMARVLKPGGQFLATREHVLFKKADLDVFLANHPLHRHYGGENAYLLHEYKEAITKAGVKITKVINPLASAINLYPRTTKDVAQLIHARLPLLPASLITPSVLSRLGWLVRSPGANYSFLGIREVR